MNEPMAYERVEVTGVVQGVGFRPFVYRVATELGLSGQIANRASQVVIEIGGHASALDMFVKRLVFEAPTVPLEDWPEQLRKWFDMSPNDKSSNAI